MSEGSTKARDGEKSLARRIARAKAQLPKAAGAKPGANPSPSPPRSAGIAGAVVEMTDETRKELETALGTRNVSFNTNLFVRTARTAFVFHGDGVHAGAEDALNQTATLVAIKAFKPTDPVEAMLAAQAVMLHNLAMEAGRRAQLPQQHPDVASKLRKDAANSARSMVEMTEAIQRRRGKGPQVVRVERVIVNEGGQAVVGHVAATSPAPPAIGQGEPPMPIFDAEPVAIREGEGKRDGERNV